MPPMLIELPPGRRDTLRPLYETFPGLRGCIDAALDGTMGRAWADDASRPTFGMVHLEFFMLAGDANAPQAEAAVRAIYERGSIVARDASWEPLIRRVWGERLRPYTRVEFGVGEWDRAYLRRFIDALPGGLALRRITMEDVARFEQLADSVVYNFASLEDFIERGVGFGIEHEGRFVSGCASFAISPHSLEFEIQTHEDFRRRGLACAAAAAMIEHCIERGLEPSWDAHNDMSAALATKLGFVNPAPYTAYELRP
ncbi:MAG: GNAT family N-acetyltransferase [Dehalococcoidia bacterium]